ncbi:Uncharacterised protein [Shigella sonnei]|nr:Uncharacterised protein [Shigella sonnei]
MLLDLQKTYERGDGIPFPYGRTERPVDGSQRYARAIFRRRIEYCYKPAASLSPACQVTDEAHHATLFALSRAPLTVEWRSQNAGFARRQYQNLPRMPPEKKEKQCRWYRTRRP